MGIFDKIKHAIWGDDATDAGAGTIEARPAERIVATAPVTASVTPIERTSTVEATPTTTASSVTPSNEALVKASPAAAPAIDVGALLDKAAAGTGQKLDWRHSIVDLMKAVGMDASLAERKELADELHYTGDKNDSAAMNTFLLKALLKKLSENGGKVPADLLD